MPTDVVMPQMGESIVEGTITKWLKKAGEKVQRDEPLFEISTDKVDAEIPAPVAGVLREIKVPEGATVQVNSVVGVIDAEGAAAGPSQPPQAGAGVEAAAVSSKVPAPPPAKPQSAPSTPPAPSAGSRPEGAKRRGDGSAAEPRAGQEETELPTYLRERAAVEPDAKPKERQAAAQHRETVIEFPESEYDRDAEGNRIRSSPLVRRMAKDSGINLNQVSGTGLGGRITKEDVLKFLEQHPAGAPAAALPAASRVATAVASPLPAPAEQPPMAAPISSPLQAVGAAVPGEVVPMTPMRKKIAERMVESKRTSAHVHSVYEVDMTRVMNLRAKVKNSFEQRTGAKMTVMPFFCRAAIHAIRQFPIINSSVEGSNIHYHRQVNLGIAVALDWGLIVPVVKRAEELNFLGLQRTITDLADRARWKKLLPDEVAGGTFTITNPGNYGQMFGLPIILQPQVAILGVGNIKKQPVVLTDEHGTDSIAIRSICHISLGYDHRVVDGAVADQFLREVAKFLENWNEDLG